METILGKSKYCLDSSEFNGKIGQYTRIWLDIGTGDGRFVLQSARERPAELILGLDACRENLVKASHHPPSNALFIIANALSLPHELHGLANHLTINFPWGSLLKGLLSGEPDLLEGLRKISKPDAVLEIRLNSSALIEAGWSLEQGGRQVQEKLSDAGFILHACNRIPGVELKACASTWAKRLAFGRNSWGFYIKGIVK